MARQPEIVFDPNATPAKGPVIQVGSLQHSSVFNNWMCQTLRVLYELAGPVEIPGIGSVSVNATAYHIVKAAQNLGCSWADGIQLPGSPYDRK